MRILVAEDDPVTRALLLGHLEGWGYEPVVALDGEGALAALLDPSGPHLAILDWMLPGVEGVEVCRRVRSERPDGERIYLLVLTSRAGKEDVVAALESGADDYLTKPFHAGELRARIRTGARLIELQDGLAARVEELEAALIREKELLGLLPICSYCRNVRDDRSYWRTLEEYLASIPEVRFSHGICPDCLEKHFPEDSSELEPEGRVMEAGE